MKSVGQSSDYGSRSGLATKYGITGYAGTAEQNTQLLNTLRSQTVAPQTTPAPQAAPVTAAPVVQNTPTPQAPKIDSQSIISKIQSGQIDPNTIDQYINDQVLSSYRNSYSGTGNNQYLNEYGITGVAAGNAIRSQLNGATFSYGGQNYQYTPSGIQKTSTTVNNSVTTAAGTTATQSAIPGQVQAPAPVAPTPATAPVVAPGAPQAAPIVQAPIAPTAAAGGGAGAPSTSTYQGASIVDYLNTVGQASDFASRSILAAKMGISGYTGTSAQNTQLLNSLRSQNTPPGTSTTMAGATTGGQTGGTSTPGVGTPTGDADTTSVIANATEIAKKFGWVAPNPGDSPLNIATNLFAQGLQSYGLNDLKTQINSTIKAQNDLNNKKADEAADINNNPWLTEGERVNRLTKLDEKYETKLDTLVNTLSLYDSEYKTGLDQVQWQVGQAMTAYGKQQDLNESIFESALTLAGKQLDAKKALETARKPIEVSAGSTLFDPETGKAIYTAPSSSGADGILSVSDAQALGVPYGTTKSGASGLTSTKNLTETQAKDYAYAQRSDQANSILGSLAPTVAGMNSAYFSTQKLLESNDLTSPMASDEIRQLRQAERNFLTAVLRRESGAAISPSEFATAEKQYFPRPGDDATTLAQKTQNRDTAIASFKANVPGYESRTTSSTPSAPAYSVGGKTYVLGADGLYYPQ